MHAHKNDQETWFQGAEEIMERMKADKKVNRDLVTYNTLMSAYAGATVDTSVQAQALVEEMKREGVQPDLITYTMLLGCHAKAGDVEKAERLVDETLEAEKLHPDKGVYWLLAVAHSVRDRLVEPATLSGILKKMRQKGLTPDEVFKRQCERRWNKEDVAAFFREGYYQPPLCLAGSALEDPQEGSEGGNDRGKMRTSTSSTGFYYSDQHVDAVHDPAVARSRPKLQKRQADEPGAPDLFRTVWEVQELRQTANEDKWADMCDSSEEDGRKYDAGTCPG
ncbi:unnamed protein product, partial [Amoebophrya sp. A120]|eukprot:GSA120T00009876001.1